MRSFAAAERLGSYNVGHAVSKEHHGVDSDLLGVTARVRHRKTQRDRVRSPEEVEEIVGREQPSLVGRRERADDNTANEWHNAADGCGETSGVADVPGRHRGQDGGDRLDNTSGHAEERGIERRETEAGHDLRRERVETAVRHIHAKEKQGDRPGLPVNQCLANLIPFELLDIKY